MIPLDLDVIKKQLKNSHLNLPFIEIFSSIDSTSDYLKRVLLSPDINFPRICLAEHQSKARSSKPDKTWYCPQGENIYFSCGFSFKKSPSALYGLSLMIGLSMVKSLVKYTANEGFYPEKLFSSNIKVKWPNDVYWQHKKLVGILTEIAAKNEQLTYAIIGIGLNVNMIATTAAVIDQSWTSLRLIFDQEHDRNMIIAFMIDQIMNDLIIFQEQGWPYFLSFWKEYDYLFGKTITIENTQGLHTGIASGVDEYGRLLLQNQTGNLCSFSTGNILKH